jgi:hypothetical protein
VGSFEAATLGDEGWDAAAGVASLKKIRASMKARALQSAPRFCVVVVERPLVWPEVDGGAAAEPKQ